MLMSLKDAKTIQLDGSNPTALPAKMGAPRKMAGRAEPVTRGITGPGGELPGKKKPLAARHRLSAPLYC
jgi:hypothetical protein